MRRRFLLSALPVSLFAARGKAQARQLDVAWYYCALNCDEILRFAEKIAAGSSGTLAVRVEPQVPTMPLAMIGKASAFAHYHATAYADAEPLFALPALPMVATTLEEADVLLRIARPYYAAALARWGQILLATEPWRPATLWSTFPIRSVGDLKGTRFAQPNSFSRPPAWPRPFLRLGVVEVGYWDAEMLLVHGIVDQFGLPTEFGFFMELFYATQLNFLTVSHDVFDSLSETQRQLLVATGRDAERAMWSAVRDRAPSEHRALARRNVVVAVQPPADLVAALRGAAEPDIEDWARAIGPDGTAIITEYRRAVRRA